MQGQCIDLPPDSVPLPRQQLDHQLWLMISLFLLDVYGTDSFLESAQQQNTGENDLLFYLISPTGFHQNVEKYLFTI